MAILTMEEQLAAEFNLSPTYVKNIIDLLNEGNTIPFIARYRKEMHGACDDQVIREFAERKEYLENLAKRKDEVTSSITEQGKMTDEIAAALLKAKTMTEVEDIYRPYKQKKKTRASVAIERGLEPFADRIFAQDEMSVDLEAIASEFINVEKGVNTWVEALQGAKDILAERVSDDAELRKILREFLFANGLIVCKLIEDADAEKKLVYETYKEHSEAIKSIPPHRVLAINRGEKEDCLKVKIDASVEAANKLIQNKFLKNSYYNDIMTEIIADSYDRLTFPSIEREVRNELTDVASEQAIHMFEVNLRPLLMQPPLKGKVIMGLDPGFRTGCKVAVIDASGNVLAHDIAIYPTHANRVEEAKKVCKKLIAEHNVDVISIGNGTASKETEIFTSEMLKEIERPITYCIVNEAGASVYSASKLAAEEFPDYDLTARSAISIARRLLDPLAELIKIDVKSIGVGQYQHDMPQKRLGEVLDGVVEDCVNSVGVELNTASHSLLARVSGLNMSIAKNIVEYRKTKKFTKREELKKVSKLGPKAFEQCAGFLRIAEGENVLDTTAVHPESYDAAQKLLSKFGYTDADVRANKLKLIEDLDDRTIATVASEIGVGAPTLKDIAAELAKPGRDVRDSLPPPVLRAEIMDMKDLTPGMKLSGVVRNVIDFGVFIDIGVHQDGLVHISRITDRFIKHPKEVVTVGDNVDVWVVEVDTQKNRIALTMLDPSVEKAKPEKRERREDSVNEKRDGRGEGQKNFGVRDGGKKDGDFRERRDGNRQFDKSRQNVNRNNNYTDRADRRNDVDTSKMSMDDMLKALQSKFGGKK